MAEQPAIADVLSSITSDIQTIVRGEIELAKAELVPQAKKVGIGAGLLGAAGYVALNGLTLLYVTLCFVASGLYMFALPPVWAYAAGFGTITLLFFVAAAILALIGKGKFEFSGAQRTVAEAELSVDAVKTAVSRGQANVASMTTATARPELAAQDSIR